VKESASDFRDTLVELMGSSPDSRPDSMDHPSPDRWLAYQRGELPAEEEARLQEHLARCRDCFDLAEGAAAFAAPDGEPGTAEETALWNLLRPQLDPPPGPVDNVRDISAGPRRRQSFGGRLPMLLAASFLVALVGMSAWNLRLRGEVDALRAPQPNAPMVDFSAAARDVGDVAPGERTVPAGAATWVFHPPGDLPVYRLTLRDAAGGGALWAVALHRDEDFALTLQLPAGLPPGRYRLELADGSGGVLATYGLRVTGRGD
jgi:hypothetical protein